MVMVLAGREYGVVDEVRVLVFRVDGEEGGLDGPSNLGAPGEGGDLFSLFRLAKLNFGLLDEANDGSTIWGEEAASKLARAEWGGVVICSSASASMDETDASFEVVGEMTGISRVRSCSKEVVSRGFIFQ